MEIKISFIIVNYKSRELLEKCISSIKRTALSFSHETIIVSNDGEVFNFPEIKTINLENNLGFGVGCNAGAKIAQGEILCFLNPDIEIISNDFQKIISEFENDPKLGIIGPKLVTENNKVQEWGAGKEINFFDIIGNNLGFKRSRKIWTSEKRVECAWVSGACLFIKKNLFERLNGFDEKFFLYFEDIDLCKRIKKFGYKIIYFPKFVIKHFGGRSFENKKYQKKYYYSSQDYYFQKHFGKIHYFLLKITRRLIV